MAETEPKSIFDMPLDEAHESRLDAEAEAAFVAGRFVPHEKVVKWLDRLAKGERAPVPRADR